MAAGIPRIKGKDSCELIDASGILPKRNAILLALHKVKLNRSSFKNLHTMLQQWDTDTIWHRFTVYNEALDMNEYERNVVLKAIVDFVNPELLLPLYYTVRAGKAFFLARNCMNAIYRIIDEEFVIPNPWNVEHSFKLIIMVNISNTTGIPVPDPTKNLSDVLKKRLNDNKVLNLERFWEDTDLQEFSPLSQPKLLVYVLFLAEKLEPDKVILCHNEIRQFPPMDLIAKSKIRRIDLKHNLISDLESIKSLQVIKSLRELDLDDNPVCEKYDNDITYFYSVKKKVCTNLEILDGKQMYAHGLPTQQATFLSNSGAATLVNNFIEYYFTSYDNDRIDLEFLYDQNAIFSLSYRIIRDKGLPKGFKNATHYQYRRQNLLDKLQRPGKFLEYGKSSIIKIICSFPETKHNPYSFAVDLLVYTTHFAVVTVSGTFEEIDSAHYDMFGFTRTFVLNTRDESTWTILNDQFHVYHPVWFKNIHVADLAESLGKMTLPENEMPSKLEKNCIILAFQKLTGLTYTFSEDYLYKAMNRFDEALKMFIDDYENDVLPINAFLNDSEKGSSSEKEKKIKGSLFTEYVTENPVQKLEIIEIDDDEPDQIKSSVDKMALPASSLMNKKPVASVAPNKHPAPSIKIQIQPSQKEINVVPAVFDLSGKAGPLKTSPTTSVTRTKSSRNKKSKKKRAAMARIKAQLNTDGK